MYYVRETSKCLIETGFCDKSLKYIGLRLYSVMLGVCRCMWACLMQLCCAMFGVCGGILLFNVTSDWLSARKSVKEVENYL